MKLIITSDLHQRIAKWDDLVAVVETERPRFVLIAGVLLPKAIMNTRTLLSITALLALFGSVIGAVPKGAAFTYQGRTGEAIRQLQEALRLKPDYADPRENLDAVLATRADSSNQRGASTHP